MVATVGRIEASPGATNVIPGRVGFSLEFRSSTDTKRKAAIEQIKADAQRMAVRRRLEFAFEPFHETNTTACTPFMQDMFADAISSLGYRPVQAALRCRARCTGDGEAVSDRHAVRALQRRHQSQSGGICERGRYGACDRGAGALHRGASPEKDRHDRLHRRQLSARGRVPESAGAGAVRQSAGRLRAPCRRIRAALGRHGLQGRAAQGARRCGEKARLGVRNKPCRAGDFRQWQGTGDRA